jgi:DNA invertase Pin-like site-specific DNA recombinase
MPMAKRLRVAIYARVSTTKASQDESPQGQFDHLRSYFVRRDDCEVVAEEFDRVSGAKGERHRPGLRKLLDLARSGRIDLLAVVRSDRLFRSLTGYVNTTQELDAIGVGIFMLDHPELDPTTPHGKFIRGLNALLAELNRDTYGNAAQEGKARAEAAGKHCARPREVVPDEALALVHSWVMASGGPDGDGALSWRAMSQRLARSKMLQPGRVIKTTGRMREARPWPPGSLWRGYMAWLDRTPPGERVQKSPTIAASLIGETVGPK